MIKGVVETQNIMSACFYDKPVDIILLLDGSGSVGDDSFASQVISNLPISFYFIFFYFFLTKKRCPF